jgi:mRNA-degrading endonuclease YafQ of YafQ-DinJ toxin-antitoxin module
MSSKLTLYIEEDVIKHVKSYAKAQKLSVSKVVNNFPTLLKDHKLEKKTVDAPLTDSLQEC